MLTILAITTLFAILAIVPRALAQAAHTGTPKRPSWLTPTEWAVGMCETGLNWRQRTRDYQGAYGFYRRSWDAFRPAGYPSEAYLASPWQQTVVMRRIRARYGWSGWGCYTHGGYRYWMGRA